MTSQPGVMVMVKALFGDGGATAKAWEAVKGQRITAAEIHENALCLTVESGAMVDIFDDGQSCCESRYMTIDDDVSQLIGGVLVNIETREMPDIKDKYGEHEQMAVKVITDQATVTLVTHNEHNGYYGGFSLAMRRVDDRDNDGR